MKSDKNLAWQPSATRRRLLGWGGLSLGLAAMPARALTREPLPVVATFSILGDMVKEIGGERVQLTTIVGPNMDAHNYEPTPNDAKALLQAKVLVLNGLDFEPWLPRLVQASGFKGKQVLASQGVQVRRMSSEHAHEHHAHGKSEGKPGSAKEANGARGDVDPHAWQDLSNGKIYVQNITEGLSKADPRNAAYYETRANGYLTRMKTLDTEVRAAIASIPPEKRRVISSHDAFGYFGAAYGIEFIPISGLSNEAEASARDLAAIIQAAREADVGGIFIENMGNPALAQQVARETGILMGGTLYADALSPPDQPAATYLGMLSWNAGRLVYVLKQSTAAN